MKVIVSHGRCMSSPGNAIVTGGGSGIGRAFCLELARRGWMVAVADINPEAAEQVVAEIAKDGGRAIDVTLDVSNAEAWVALRDELSSLWGSLDLLVNCAGVLVTGLIAETKPADSRRIVEVNLLGAMLGCQAMTPWLIESSADDSMRGVVNVASIFAAVAPPGFAAYNATKAGVVALTESLRGELIPHGLSATVVLPGVTPTNLFKSATYASPKHAELSDQFVAASKIAPEQVASQSLDTAERGRLYCVVGERAKWYWRLKHWAPAWLIDKVGRRAARELGIGAGKADPGNETSQPIETH